ncbi:hypothetical protein [Pseudanabaena sp. 'Roaring Creek']|uniref:hypothetical protein n=1 Tax=Pseudanabaena sp. 'Roaring Creek' TaxID=1681830 RepID=UPI0006D776C3|nr:hypothetical protein [Pseudanabaena sp. 'Roaring Creek']
MPDTPIDPVAIPDLPSSTATETITPDSPITNTDNSGLNVPDPNIEKKTISLGVTTARIQNLVLSDFLKPDSQDNAELTNTKNELIQQLTIDTEIDNCQTRIEKQLNLFFLQGFSNLATVYGIPAEIYDENVQYKPHLIIKFKEKVINPDDIPFRIYKLEKEISFRYMDETKTPKNQADLNDLTQKILAAFALPFKWVVSPTDTYHYRDKANGYRLSIDASNDLALEIINKIISFKDDTFDEQFLGHSIHGKSTPKKATYFGNEIDLPFRGRYGDVYLYQATYNQHGIKPKTLIDGFTMVNDL